VLPGSEEFGRIQSGNGEAIAVQLLVDFITLCVQHPAAANEVFLVADDMICPHRSFCKKSVMRWAARHAFTLLPPSSYISVRVS